VKIRWWWALVLVTAALGQNHEAAATALLQKHCLGCHNGTARTAGLSLESRGEALAKLAAVKDRVVRGQMPPGQPLTERDRQVIAAWVDGGAPWAAPLAARKRAGADWWSLQPLRAASGSIAGSIDTWIDQALQAKGLTANGEADRRTLIRRVTFDVTGLPPTPEDVEAFVGDNAPGAYEKLVDRLLASTAYGERWGRHWMDVIRFGESHGYEQNHLRADAWPFRDYIIRSFNEDKPYDRLMLEHLAGDVVGAGDPAVEIGTAFLVAGPHDTVGNQNEAARRQQRADDLDDMIIATSSAFLGLTVGSARCDDHKFDPIQQRDYYRVAALLNGVVHAGREMATPDERARHRAQAEPLERRLKEAASRLAEIREEAEPSIAAQREAILAPYRPAVNSQLTEEKFERPVRARWLRLRIHKGAAAGLEEIEVWAGGVNVAAGARAVASSTRVADGNAEAYAAALLTDGKFDRRWFAAAPAADVTIEWKEPAMVERVTWSRDRAGGFQGRFASVPVSEYDLEVSFDGQAWTRVASHEGRLPPQPDQVERLLLLAVTSRGAEYLQAERDRQAAQAELARLPKLPTAYAGRLEQPKEPVYLLKGGNVMNRGDAVVPESLSTLPFAPFTVPEDRPEGERRVALARWLGDARNPLTARVMANRLWHYHFGRGLVGTPSDFGFNGERPTHPELLDYLASRLLAYGWRLKPLHREILLSAAYRRASTLVEAQARVDAESRLLWRYPPQRLSAEAIRDTILAVSGKLDRRMGGPGFHLFRYTVDNVATYFPAEKFGPETYRRAVYQTAARSVRSELLGQYDCPDSSLPEPKRIVTTSPLQALALMNNVFVLDQAAHLAARLESEAAPGGRVARAFALAFGRAPTASETTAADALIREHGLTAFARALLNANELIYVM